MSVVFHVIEQKLDLPTGLDDIWSLDVFWLTSPSGDLKRPQITREYIEWFGWFFMSDDYKGLQVGRITVVLSHVYPTNHPTVLQGLETSHKIPVTIVSIVPKLRSVTCTWQTGLLVVVCVRPPRRFNFASFFWKRFSYRGLYGPDTTKRGHLYNVEFNVDVVLSV